MARARNIKPSILKNELLGTGDPLAYILFTGLWMLADREGRLEDRPLRIKAEVFPYRPEVDINAQLDWLTSNGFLERYEASGHKIIAIKKFLEHQRPHPSEAISVLPDSPKASARKTKATPRCSTEDNLGVAQTRLLSDPLLSDPLLSESPLLGKDIAGSPPDESKPPPVTVIVRPRNLLFDAIAEASGFDPKTAGGSIGKVADVLKKADYTPDDVREFAQRFWELCPHAADSKRERPTPTELQKYIGLIRAKPAPKQHANGKARDAGDVFARQVNTLNDWINNGEAQ